MEKNTRNGFTLIEMLVVTVLASFIFIAVISLFMNMMSTRADVEVRQSLIQNSYFMLEKLNTYIKDYTIDYEEYYERKIIGCEGDSGPYSSNFSSFNRKDGADGYCSRFTNYGNGNYIAGSSSDWKIYSCSSDSTESSPNTVYRIGQVIPVGSGCARSDGTDLEWQSYGVYAKQFWDVHKDVDGKNGIVGDDDDDDLGMGPTAIANNTGVQELYLINKSGDKRYYIRRQKVGTYSGGTASLYNLKALKLKGFDAGKTHDFSSAGTYDGQIDTWACDFGEGFECNGNPISTSIYPGYKLPNDANDGWIEVFGRDLNVADWNLEIYPNTDPTLAWKMDNMQINPYIKIYIKTKLNPDVRSVKFSKDRLEKFEMDLGTTFNIKSNY